MNQVTHLRVLRTNSAERALILEALQHLAHAYTFDQQTRAQILTTEALLRTGHRTPPPPPVFNWATQPDPEPKAH